MFEDAPVPVATTDPTRLIELGELLAEREGLRRKAARQALKACMGARFLADLVEDVVSAWTVELVRRCQRLPTGMTVEEWLPVIWRNTLRQAVRVVDQAQGAPIRQQRRHRLPRVPDLSRPLEDTDGVDEVLANPEIAAARIALVRRPEAMCLVEELLRPPRLSGRPATVRARILAHRERVRQELRSLLESSR